MSKWDWTRQSFIVNLLCILINLEEKKVNCPPKVVESDAQNHDGQVGEDGGHVHVLFMFELLLYFSSKDF